MIKSYLYITVLFFCLSACNEGKKPIPHGDNSDSTKATPSAIISTLDIQFKTIKDSMNFETGTSVKTKGSIQFRELTNEFAILNSGFPIKFGVALLKGFELNSENGILPETNLKFYTSNQHISVWYYDLQKGNWDQISSKNNALAKPTKQKTENAFFAYLKSNKILFPIKPSLQDTTKINFNLNVSEEEFPEIKGYKNMAWQYVGNSEATNPVKNEWAFATQWTKIALEPSGNDSSYLMIFSNPTKEFRTEVKPIFEKKDLSDALLTFQKRFKDFKIKNKNAVTFFDRLKSFEAQKILNNTCLFTVSKAGFYIVTGDSIHITKSIQLHWDSTMSGRLLVFGKNVLLAKKEVKNLSQITCPFSEELKDISVVLIHEGEIYFQLISSKNLLSNSNPLPITFKKFTRSNPEFYAIGAFIDGFEP